MSALAGNGNAALQVRVHRRVLELRRLRERAADLAVTQAGRKAAQARAEVERMQAHIGAERHRLQHDIGQFDLQADSCSRPGRWFINGRNHFDQRRVEIERLKLQLAALQRTWQECRQELARCRQVYSVMQARREQIQKLTRRLAMRERARLEAQREAGIAELLSARAQRSRAVQRAGGPA